MRKFYCLLVGVVLLNAGGVAQVTTNGGSGLAATYPSLAAAVTALNAATITSPVIITLSGSETAPNGTGYYITATGTAVNTIIIQGTGTLTAGLNTAGGNMDAIIKIVGGDWITIRNFDFAENASNVVTATGVTNTMTEAGILLIHANATNGAQNNSILNNSITLSAVYPNAVAIFSTAASSTTNASPGANSALDATSTAGTNSGNKIYNNTIFTCAYGIMFICPPITATVFETGNDIGGTSAATQNVLTGYGNNIASTAPWNRASPSSGGIVYRNGAGNNISYNNVTSISNLTVASTGILISGTPPSGVTYTSTIKGNLIYLYNTGFTAITGIDFGFGISTGTIIGSENSVEINQTSAGANSAAIIGIKANYPSATNTVSTNAVGIYQNTSAGLTTSSVTAITCAGIATGNLINVTNNLITIKQNNSGTGFYGAGPVTYLDVSPGTLNTQIVNVTGNTFNTTGSVIRSQGDMIAISCNSTVGLYNIKSNTANIVRVASIGNAYFTFQTTSPSAVADTVSDNNITINGLITSGNVTAISQLGGPFSGGAKSICNNSITLGNFGTGPTTGIAWGYSLNAKVSGNTLSVISAGPTVTGLDGTSTGAGGGGGIGLNTIFLSSSTTSPTAMTGINLGANGPFTGVTDNTFSGLNFTGIITGAPVVTGIAIAAGTGNTIFGNTIKSISTGATGSTASPVISGILISGGTSTSVYKNKIYGFTTAATGNGTIVNGIRITGGTTNTVYNNLIGNLAASAATSSDALRGISITSTSTSTTQNIYYNTVYLSGSGGTNFGSTGIFHNASTTATTSTLNLRNNIFVNACTPNGTGLAVAFRRSSGAASTLANYASTSNNNLFYAGTPGASNLIYSDGTSTATTITAYKSGVFTAGTISPRDAVSVSENPPFLSLVGSTANFLHIDPTIATQVESGATPIAGITDDFDADVRNATTPDIGADEFMGITLDLTGPIISYTSLTNSCTPGVRTLTATITDGSGVPTSGVGLPVAYFKINAGSYNAVQGVSIGSNQYTFNIGTGSVATDVVSYYVVAQDNAATPNVSVFPAAGASGTSINPPAASTPPTTPDSYTVLPTLSGTYTVGVTGNYVTLTAAVAAYNANCISGAVVFSLIDATYPSETFPITINANATASAVNTLTIKPAATIVTTISGSSASCLINLNGADFVTINGSNNGTLSRDLTFTNTNAGTSSAVTCITSLGAGLGAINNSIKNTNLAGTTVTATNGTLFGIYSGGSAISNTSLGIDNDNNTIQNNNITKTQYGIYSSGESAGNKNTGTVISQNVMNAVSPNNLNLGGIYVRFDDGIQLSQNDISTLRHDGTVGQTGTTFGIALGVVPTNTVTTFTGSDVTNAVVTSNKINGITQLHATGFSAFGIIVNSVTSGTSLVANNMISGVRAASTASDFSAGIVAGGGTGSTTNIYFNSVSMTGSRNAASFPSYCLAISSGDPVTNIKNNIFQNTQSTSSSGKMYAIGTGSGTFVNMTSDYNDLYVSGTSTFIGQTGGLGTGGTDRATLANWQTTTTKDANSLNLQPNFVSASDLHLVATTNCRLDGYGTPIAGITTDYDNNTRDAGAPDMGADEFTTTPAPSTMTTASNCDTKNVSPLGTLYVDGSCNLIAKVLPSGGSAVTGKIKTCTTLDGTQQTFNGQPYVQRHYDIEPTTSPATATGTITLYFTDLEFANYNLNNPAWPPLPTVASGGNASIYLGNVKVTQFHGVGSTSPTSPGNYPGTVVLITPVTKFYNGSFWELTFNVTGFSGFYVHTNNFNSPLPVIVNYLTGRIQGSNHLLNWKVTCTTTPRATMTLERSSDARNFSDLYTITADAARCNSPFDYTDANPLKGMNYYRLKMVDADGKVTYSTTVALLNAVKGFDIVSIAPNPVVSNNFKLNIASAQAGKMEMDIFDMQGRLVNRQSISLIAGYNSMPINVANLSPGTYTIKGRMDDDQSKVIRFVKQ